MIGTIGYYANGSLRMVVRLNKHCNNCKHYHRGCYNVWFCDINKINECENSDYKYHEYFIDERDD